MSHWNYRIIYHADKQCVDGYLYELHEVFYDDKGQVTCYTAEPSLTGESKAEIVEELVMMLQDVAGRHPLNGDEIDREIERRDRLIWNRAWAWWHERVYLPLWFWWDDVRGGEPW